MKKLIPFIFGTLFLTACNNKVDCGKLSTNFETFQEARKEISQADFPFKKIQSTPESSWIKRIEYYSCDERDGYLIIYTTRGEEYIHAHVPKSIWEELSASKSKGSYYNTNLVNRYPFHLKTQA